MHGETEDIARCHFCGGRIKSIRIEGQELLKVIVDCEQCGEIYLFNHFRTRADAEAGAVKLWNSFTPDDAKGGCDEL